MLDRAGRLAPEATARPWLFARFMRLIRLSPTDPLAIAGVSIYLVFLLVAAFANVIVTQDPTEILFLPDGNLAANLKPSLEFPLGTTNLGRDIFSQLVLGTRSAFFVGIAAALAVVSCGTVVGLVSGYFGGRIDQLLMRLADVALGIPFLPFVIVLAAFLGPKTENVIFAIAVLLWPNSARVIRSQVLTLRERGFVEAARVAGSSHLRIIAVHIAPNVLPLSMLYGSIAVGWAILTEASVSFLGFGPSNSVSWGAMLQDAYASQALSRGSYNWFVPPGLCIVLVVVAGFFVSRGYEEILFPKLKD